MSSWVRYCVAVYFGLLLSGSLTYPGLSAERWPGAEQAPQHRDATVPERRTPHDRPGAAEHEEVPETA